MKLSEGSLYEASAKMAAIVLVAIVVLGAIAYYFFLLPKPYTSVKGEEGGIIKVGLSTPLTGDYSAIGKDYLRGVQAWADWVNSHGGINVGGKYYNVTIIHYDDTSNPNSVPVLYRNLLDKDHVDFLVSPPVDELARQAIQVAEARGKIIIVTTPEEELFRHALRYSYQIVTPASQFFTPVLDMAKNLDPNSTTIALVFLDTPATRAMASGIKLWATENGYQIVFEYYYPAGTENFDSLAVTVKQKAPDIILGGGGITETINLVKTFYDRGVRPKVLALLDAPLTDEFKQLGDIAVGVIGVSEWEPFATYSPFYANKLNISWYGPSLTEFIIHYNELYGIPPSPKAAEGFAAGLILQYAIEKAGSTDTNKVMEALDQANILTFYGVIAFDSTPELHGLQIGHKPIVVQWVERGGSLTRVVVAPVEFAVAQPIYPLPWS